jgi:hypothetical protein
MVRSELRNAVKDRLAIRSDGSDESLDGLITNAFVNTSIDDALNRVSMERDWWWLATTTTLTFAATTGQATLPTGFMRGNQLVINDSPVQPLPLDTFLDPNADSNAYGWLIYGNTVRITPPPTASTTGTFYYFRSEPALATDATSPLMPVVYHKCIVAYASHLCAARRQDEARAALYLQEYGNFLKSMNDDNRATIQRRIKFSRAMSDAAWS